MVRAFFGKGVCVERVGIRREKYVFFQGKDVTMAPDGDVWFHPEGGVARSAAVDDFSLAGLGLQKHFMHEMTHVWQFQQGVDLVREKVKMFFRYGASGGYGYEEGGDFEEMNIEQQAMFVADLFGKGDVDHPVLVRLRGGCAGGGGV